jgi:hypothetical protein
MNNPYLTAFGFLVSAFQALTCKEARRFYADTAIEHSFLTVAVTGIAVKKTIEAGQAFRQFHDSAIVPCTLFVLVGLHQFIQRLDHEEIEQYQTALPYASAPIALLPAAKERERVLVTPCVTVERVLVTAAPMEAAIERPAFEETAIRLERLFEMPEVDALIPQVEPVEVQAIEVESKPITLDELSDVDDEADPYAEYGFKQLQSLCKQYGVSAKGSRDALIARITKAEKHAQTSECKGFGKPIPRTAKVLSIK